MSMRRRAEEDPIDESPLEKADAKLFRGVAARLNYLGPDRPDMQYAIKEAARCMASPRQCDWPLLKKIGRYLLYRPRLILRYKWQKRPGCIDGYTDSDWAGCTQSRRSTSGGVIMVGHHVVKSYSKQQKVLALSSAEAETYGMVACSAEVLGIQACAADMGLEYTASIYADASAALGIVQRRGVGKVRHIRTQSLWLQEAHATKRLGFEKIDGSRNPADLMTKHLSDTLQQRHPEPMLAIATDGRAQSAPTLNTVEEENDRYFFGVVFEDENKSILKKVPEGVPGGGRSEAGGERARTGGQRTVRFAPVVRCKFVIPYSSVYGRHPREFDFDSSGRKVARKLQHPAPHAREIEIAISRESPVNTLSLCLPTARIESRQATRFVGSPIDIIYSDLVDRLVAPDVARLVGGGVSNPVRQNERYRFVDGRQARDGQPDTHARTLLLGLKGIIIPAPFSSVARPGSR